jgi:hypothetical protein
MKIKVIRCEYGTYYTRGVVVVDGKFFGYSLEDAVRTGPKIPGETAIASGIYKTVVTYSPRFKRDMPLLLDVPSFEGVRYHGGNTSKDTEGCILIASNSILKDMIQGTLEKKLTKLIKESGGAITEVVDTKDRK